MKIIQKDITTVEFGTIVHQVNCQGVMGSGVALAIRNRWPIVYDSYIGVCTDGDQEFVNELLGRIDIYDVQDNLSVINLFGQLEYRRGQSDKKRFTSYSAWEIALYKIAKAISYERIKGPIYMPYLVGCDRGGGNWEILSRMIQDEIPDVVFCKYP